MQVNIFSTMAAICGSGITTWSGDVPVSNPDEAYRFFNRVDDEDCDRLENLGYHLPSLSVGDFITIGEVTWRVDGIGFTRITENADYAAKVLR